MADAAAVGAPAAEAQAPAPSLTNIDPALTNPGQQPPASQKPAEGQQEQKTDPVDPNAEPKQEPLVTPPQAAVEEVPFEAGEDGAVVYDQTGDAALDVALAFVGKLGIAGNDPAMVAAANGNFTLIEAKLAVLGDKAAGWPQMVALAKEAFGRADKLATEQAAATDKAVLSVVQSVDNWNAIKVWAASNATPEEKAAINQMIDAGPVQARAAATILLEAYTKAKGTVINPASAARTASGEAPQATNTKLSPREYASEVAVLHRKLGSRMEASPEYKALRARLA